MSDQPTNQLSDQLAADSSTESLPVAAYYCNAVSLESWIAAQRTGNSHAVCGLSLVGAGSRGGRRAARS
jgi:hypothetical protein